MNGIDTEEHFGACRSRQRLTDGKNLLVLVTYQRMILLIEVYSLTIGSSIHLRSVTNLSWNCAAVSLYSVAFSTDSSYGLELYSGTAKCCEAYMPIGHNHISISSPYPHLLLWLSEEQSGMRA